MRSNLTNRVDVWTGRGVAWGLLLLLASPVMALVVKGGAQVRVESLLHLGRTVLPMQLGYALLVSVGVVVLGSLLAAGAASCAVFEFPGRTTLDRLVLVPLLLPGWFVAHVHAEVLGTSGTWGLVVALGVGAAPLFHLLTTAALRGLPRPYVDMLRALGHGNPSTVVRVLLPLSLPALGGAALVAFMSAWSDVAAARVMAVPTVAVGLYDQWFGREDDVAGAGMALILLVLSVVPGLLLWAVFSRATHQDSARLVSGPTRLPLKGWHAGVPWLLSLPQVVVGLLVPFGTVAVWTWERINRVKLDVVGQDMLHALLVAGAGTACAALLALLMLHPQAVAPGRKTTLALGLIALANFALPPLVLGLAFLWLVPGNGELRVWLNATPLPWMLALGLRFCAVFLAAGKAALLRRAHAHGDMLRMLDRTDLWSFVRLLRPYLGRPFLAASAFVFIEALKDLPLALILQPFGFTTLSMRMFQYAQSQRLKECAVWVVCMVLVGIYPLFSLVRQDEEAPG